MGEQTKDSEAEPHIEVDPRNPRRLEVTDVARQLTPRLRASPPRLRARRTTRVRVRVTAGGRPVSGALVRLAGSSRRTGRAGRLRATATHAGYRTGRLNLRVR